MLGSGGNEQLRVQTGAGFAPLALIKDNGGVLRKIPDKAIAGFAAFRVLPPTERFVVGDKNRFEAEPGTHFLPARFGSFVSDNDTGAAYVSHSIAAYIGLACACIRGV